MAEQTIYATLVGGGLAMTGALSATWLTKHLERRYQSQQLAKAIKGELSAISHIVTLRGYVNSLRNLIAVVEHTKIVHIFTLEVSNEYCAVYKGNTDRIGNLPGDLPTAVAIAYTQIFSIIEDFKTLAADSKKPHAEWTISVDEVLRKYVALVALIEDTLARSDAVVAEIDHVYSKGLWHRFKAKLGMN